MPYDEITTNSMQANLGLMPGWAPPQMMHVPPAMAAQQLQAQASQQLAGGMAMTRLPAATPVGIFGQQFQQQMQMAQAQQSYNPYVAQALSGGYPGSQGFSQGMMPSPLMMTPPSTGIFRPPPQMQMSAIPPQQVAPIWPGPFTPQLPSPMFQTAWDRELQQREYRADRLYSMAAQTPHALGTAAGIGGGALAGAAVGRSFGPMGAAIGAIGGGVLAGISGAAGALGDLSMTPMRPSLEVHGMAASLQRMSQQWMVTGPQLHQQGAGLARGPAQDLADQIRTMSVNRGFRNETGGAFNREDLMRITELSGRAGLMDMEQGTDAIRNNLRQVSRVVRRFMELTGDPDVTSVIREMGQMRAFGMSVPEMERSAQNMKTFARAAGTTIGGLQQMGGMPGAMMYQGMGLSAASGFEMGNFALAAARQAVAMGTYNPRELSMMGGVQGLAQRNMQAQAALTSMPLFGAAIGGFGAQGWGVNYGQLAQVAQGGQGGLGAAGMVYGAVQNIGQAVARGGIGALAEYPLRQRFMQDEAARAMHPAQQMAMRFQMAMQTGQTLGLQGTAAFTTGARALYGDEVAEQMLMEARNPEQFREQARMLRRQPQEIARRQRADIMAAAPGFTDILGDKLGITAGTRGPLTSLSNTFGNIGLALGRDNPVLQYFEDKSARERGERIVRVNPMVAIENEKQRESILKGIGRGEFQDKSLQGLRESAGKLQASGWVQQKDIMTLASPALGEQIKFGGAASEYGLTAASIAASFFGPVGVAVGAGLGTTAAAVSLIGGENISSGIMWSYLDDKQRAAVTKRAQGEAQVRNTIVRASQRTSLEGLQKVDKALGARFGSGSEGASKATLARVSAASALARRAKEKVGFLQSDSDLTSGDVSASIVEGFKAQGMSEKEAVAAFTSMSADEKREFVGAIYGDAKTMGGSYAAGVFQKSEELAGAAGLSGAALKESLAARSAKYEEAIGWEGESDVGAQALRGKMKELNPMDYLAMLLGSGSATDKQQKEIRERFMKATGGKGDFTAFQKRGVELAKGLTQEARDALSLQASKLTTGQIVGQVETKRTEVATELSESGLRALGKAAGVGGMEAFAGVGTGAEIVSGLGELGLENLRKGGGAKKLVGLIDRFNREKDSAKKAQLANQISEESARWGQAQAGSRTEVLGTATGEGAAQGEAGAAALDDLAATLEGAGFDVFKQGAVNLLEGAAQLRKAMETETMKRLVDEAQKDK
jgi:hypothetical protein